MARLVDFQIAALTVAALSAIALLLALASQIWGGLAPCPLCLDQRIAYYVAVPAGLAAVWAADRSPGAARLLLGAIGLALLYNAGLGVYHAGVEWKWWPGPQSCSGAGFTINAQDLLNGLAASRVVRCDEAPFRLAGLSLAGMSALLSLVLAALALVAAARRLDGTPRPF